MKYGLEFLKNNPIIWTRLGFCYDPPIPDENGEPLVFTKDFEQQLSVHRDFINVGVRIHTSILHLGWVGVDKYDYTLTDRVLDAIFSLGDDVLYIPRIKLNVPVDWCREYPEEVFVYSGGSTDAESIRGIVGTERQDYLGYESECGYYRAGDYTDTRANVGGLIARQSFSSERWIKDASEALSRLIDRLENSKYADRIIGYHIGYGISGETVTWGRINRKFGDYGIANRRAFLNFGIQKYGSIEKCAKAWQTQSLSYDNVPIPPEEKRAAATGSLEVFLRGRSEDRYIIDYDEFASLANERALESFARLVKEKTGKLVGAFYGYLLFIGNAAYSAHTALSKLLRSEYIDFFASPKSYAKSGAGEPGGEICPAQSINLRKLFVDELDNRTFLATENAEDIAKGMVASNINDTFSVMWREVAKNLSHDSGFWWMDLGGGWFADKRIMSEISRLVNTAEKIRASEHKSISDVLILYDESSFRHHCENPDFHRGFLRELISDCACSGAVADVYCADDLDLIDFSQYKLIFLAYNTYVSDKLRGVISSLDDNVFVRFAYVSGAVSEDGFSLGHSEALTGYRISALGEGRYGFPNITATPTAHARPNFGVITEPFIGCDRMRALALSAGCHLYTDRSGATVYADNRFVGVFTGAEECRVTLPERATYRDLISGRIYPDTDTVSSPNGKNQALLLVKDG